MLCFVFIFVFIYEVSNPKVPLELIQSQLQLKSNQTFQVM